jgi:ubiquitin-conjugating enzyme E2 S
MNLLTTLLRVSFSIKTPMATFKTYKLIFLDQVFSHYFNNFLVGTPYENGVFRCKIVLTDNFPANPPKGYFLTKIFHPNVAQPSGDICVNTLKKDWNP